MYYEYDNGVVSDRLILPIIELNGMDFADVRAILSFAATTNQTVAGHMDSTGMEKCYANWIAYTNPTTSSKSVGRSLHFKLDVGVYYYFWHIECRHIFFSN